MKIEIHNTESRVLEADEVELQWLRDFLTYENSSFRFNGGDRYQTLLTPDRYFPSGFIPNIRRAFAEDTKHSDLATPGVLAGRSLSFTDARPPIPEPNANADVEWLRHHPAAMALGHDPIKHQIEAYNAATRLRRGVIWIPTGGGKGEILAALTRAYPTVPILVLLNENVDQLSERIERRTSEAVGRCGEGKLDTSKRITVANFQTLVRRLRAGHTGVADLLGRVQVLLVDECHQLPANGMYTVAMRTVNAPIRIGLSATPSDRTDTKNLFVTGCLGPIIYRVFPQTLIDLGIISAPDIRMVPCVQRSELTSWPSVYDELVVESKQRNGTIRNIALVAPQPGFVFVEREKHGRILKRTLEKAGLNTEFVWGSVSPRRRKELLRQMLDGSLNHLVCSGVFRQGLDVPTLTSVINAAGRASTTWTLQRLGRGSRADAATEKYEFQYWDILDHGQRWLEDHSEKRVAAFRQEGYVPKVVMGLEEPDEWGEVPDFRVERSGIEIYREEQKKYRDALFALTGQRHIRKKVK